MYAVLASNNLDTGKETSRGGLRWCAACVFGWLVASVGAVQAQSVAVEISGVDGQLAANVRSYLDIAKLSANTEERLNTTEDERSAAVARFERRVRQAHARAESEILNALRPFGYYSPNVLKELSGDGDAWVARYQIEPGEPVVIAGLAVTVEGEGRTADPVRVVLADLGIRSGQVLQHAAYEIAKSRLFESVYGAGYIDASYARSEMRVEPEIREADIWLTLNTGPRYYFGDIVIEQDILNADVVDRLVDIEPGQPFDSDQLIGLQFALDDSGFFGDVTIEVLRNQAVEQRIPIVVHTTPRPNQAFTVGAGYGTDTGPRAVFGLELRRVNPAGHRFQLDTRLSARESKVVGEYRVPVRNFNTDFVSYRASLGIDEVGDYDTEQALIGAAWNDTWRGISRRIYLEALREDFSVSDEPTESGRALYPGISLSYKRADDPLFARRGWSWSLDARLSSESLFGSADFQRVTLTGDHIRPLGERSRLLLRGQLGTIQTDDFTKIVPSQRFFAGGDRSVRGYEFESLAPRNALGAVIGGRYLATASVELDWLIAGDYGAAVFYDVGNAANNTSMDLKRGVGIGFRWRTPVGMLRVDFAHPLDDPNENLRLHITIGTPL